MRTSQWTGEAVGQRIGPSGAARLRLATGADVEALKLLEDQCFSHDCLSRRSIRRAVSVRSQAVLVGERPCGGLLGAAFLHFRQGSCGCRLYSLAVRRGAANQGLGSKLVAACQQAARDHGCSLMWLEVRTDRSSLVSFYEKRGFRKSALKLRFYEDGCDAFVMHKSL